MLFRSGLARPEVNSRLCAISIAGAFTFAIFENRDEEDLQDPEEFSHQLVGLMIDGLGTDRAREALSANVPGAA